MKRNTCIAYHPDLLLHTTEIPHPESPDRLKTIQAKLKQSFKNSELTWLDVEPALECWIEANHCPTYIRKIESFSKLKSPLRIDNDTIACSSTGHVSNLAAGAVIQAVDFVMSKRHSNAFCAIRPPGHHAEYDHAMGFCFLNNVAIGAHYAMNQYQLSRIAIIDFDVHHGNGTQNSFYKNDKVFYLSLHEHPLFPGSGKKSQIGEKQGINTTLNIPLPPGTSEKKYRKIFTEVALPAIYNYEPELILLSTGFDAHKLDPLSSLQISTSYFGELTKQIVDISDEFCDGRIVSCMEGGYHIDALSESVVSHILALRSSHT